MRNRIGIACCFLSLLTPVAAEELNNGLVEMSLHSVSLDPLSNQPPEPSREPTYG